MPSTGPEREAAGKAGWGEEGDEELSSCMEVELTARRTRRCRGTGRGERGPWADLLGKKTMGEKTRREKQWRRQRDG